MFPHLANALQGLYPVSNLGRRAMATEGRIEINPKIMLGKPIVRGTRLTVELILRKLAEGATQADLLDAYPQLTVDDVRAVMRYAADTIAHEETVSVEHKG
jgi:uncharacterized protein (DUF433 family)